MSPLMHSCVYGSDGRHTEDGRRVGGAATADDQADDSKDRPAEASEEEKGGDRVEGGEEDEQNGGEIGEKSVFQLEVGGEQGKHKDQQGNGDLNGGLKEGMNTPPSLTFANNERANWADRRRDRSLMFAACRPTSRMEAAARRAARRT